MRSLARLALRRALSRTPSSFSAAALCRASLPSSSSASFPFSTSVGGDSGGADGTEALEPGVRVEEHKHAPPADAEAALDEANANANANANASNGEAKATDLDDALSGSGNSVSDLQSDAEAALDEANANANANANDGEAKATDLDDALSGSGNSVSDLQSDADADADADLRQSVDGHGNDGDDGGSDSDAAVFVEDLKPSEVISALDRHIVGQEDAKRAVAIALRNRWRRQKLPEHVRREIVPRNMLMIGPTGCGKTEIARRLSQLMEAPFIKVEATKFTEVGFHGRDVDTIIRDLVEQGIQLAKKTRKKRLKEQITEIVETKILEALMGHESVKGNDHHAYLKFLRDGKLDDQRIDVEVPAQHGKGGQGAAIAIDPSVMQSGSLDQLFGRFAKAMNSGGGKTVKKNLKIKEARPILEDMEMEQRLESDDVLAEAIRNVEQNGIVFIDEIDKICTPSGEARFSGDASAEGVQRDLLPLVEGSTVSTKHGNINTDYILFICSGAFHQCKPSDMLPELQGRLPIRVELKGLSEGDMYRILTEPETNLIEQHRCLLEAEGVELDFPDEVITRVAAIAAEVNHNVENIGARRLYTVLERIMEDYSFDAADMEPGSKITVSLDDVEEHLGGLMKHQDLQKYIL